MRSTREKATKELERLGETAVPSLEKSLATKSSKEVRFRIRQILEKRKKALAPEEVRVIRAIEALERAGTAEARELLERLARGAPEARLTREAKSALANLAVAPRVP